MEPDPELLVMVREGVEWRGKICRGERCGGEVCRGERR